MESVKLRYTGKNAHAAGNPWEGVNALNAVIQAFNNVDAMRQQMKPSWRVHGIITQGGLKPNIIPNDCTAEWCARHWPLVTGPPDRPTDGASVCMPLHTAAAIG
jgi:metal-dependent amidase/aminoacylase/carboxypeptidase family protein